MDAGTDAGRDGAAGSGGSGGTDAGRGGAAGAPDAGGRDAGSRDGDGDAPSSDAPSDARTDVAADVRRDGTGGTGGTGGGPTDDGCDCRIAQGKDRQSNGGWVAPLLGAIALLARRRRRD